jgi:hypothetical protein
VSRETLQRFMPEVYRRFDRQSFNGTIGHVRYGPQKDTVVERPGLSSPCMME